MPRKKQYQTLYVYMNGIHVGLLEREITGNLSFTYDQDWLHLKNSRPISLSMPLTEVPYKGYLVENYFDNLLPDNELIRNRIQTRFNSPSKKCFDLLSYIGMDCVGALQLLTQSKVKQVKKIQASPIKDKEIATLLKHYKTAPLGMDRELDFRISVAGAQEKTALLWHQKKWYLPHGITPTSHIIKLPIGQILHSGIDLSESVENEWICLKILKAFKLPVNEAKIKYFDDVKTLVVERFDRRRTDDGLWIMRLPQEDLCQALGVPSALKYEHDGGPSIHNIMDVLRGSKNAIQDREQFMKTVFLFWILGAIDGHAKNFSLSIEAQGRYQLTPIYDVISAYPLLAKKQLAERQIKMAMSVKGTRRHYQSKTIQIRHWLATAVECQFSQEKMQEIIHEVCDTLENVIDQVASSLPSDFPQHISNLIFEGMREIRDRC